MSYRRFAVKLISHYVRNINIYARQVRSGEDAEALHQLRVYLRRLRNLLWMFRGLFPGKQLSLWEESMRAIAQASSPIRDLDVYVDYLKQYKRRLVSLAAKKVLDGLIRDARKRRRKLPSRLDRALDSFARKRVFQGMAKSLKKLSKEPPRESTAKIYKICRKRIFKRVGNLLAFDSVVYQPANVKELHRMRIAAKHLRYSLEAVEEIYGREINSYIQHVVSFHRSLGEIHDYDVWLMHIAERVKSRKVGAQDKPALNRLQRYTRISRNKAYKEFAAHWSRSKRDRFFEDLMEYIYAYRG